MTIVLSTHDFKDKPKANAAGFEWKRDNSIELLDFINRARIRRIISI
jgi:hypothetical protein